MWILYYVVHTLVPTFKDTTLFSPILLMFFKFYYFVSRSIQSFWNIVSSSIELSNLSILVKEININILNESVKTSYAYFRSVCSICTTEIIYKFRHLVFLYNDLL